MTIHTEARIKGGMPILIEAEVLGRDVECVDLSWPNTGEPTTQAFIASLSDDDWNIVYDAVHAAHEAR